MMFQGVSMAVERRLYRYLRRSLVRPHQSTEDYVSTAEASSQPAAVRVIADVSCRAWRTHGGALAARYECPPVLYSPRM